jgi:NADPH2:quinone reductase
VRLAAASGCVVIGTAGSEPGRAAVLAAGARHVLDHGRAGYLDGIADLAGGRGPDVILEMLADRNLAADMAVAAKGARIVVIGSRGSISVEPRAAMAKDLVVLGMSLFNAPEEELLADHREIGRALESGMLRPVIGAEFPLAEAAAAHARVMAPGALGKVVLVP